MYKKSNLLTFDLSFAIIGGRFGGFALLDTACATLSGLFGLFHDS